MLRATAWTVGLFGAGAAISRLFPSPWTEPLVLLALGMAFLFVSRTAPRRRPATAPDVVATLPARQPLAKPSAAAAPVPVEQSA
jgi:hypothetical protein